MDLSAMVFDPFTARSSPASGFRPAGDVRHCSLVAWTPLPKPSSIVQRQGIRYEKVFHAVAREMWGSAYHTFHPTYAFSFRAGGLPRLVVPDALLDVPDTEHTVIIECKLTHTVDAYYQLQQLYRPVVSAHPKWKGRTFSLVEICKSYDPVVPIPGGCELLSTMLDIPTYRGERMGVLPWSK